MAERADVYRGPSRFPTIYYDHRERHPIKLPSGEVVEGLRATVFHKMTAINSPLYALPQEDFKTALFAGGLVAEDRFWGAVSRLCMGEAEAISMQTVEGPEGERRLFVETNPGVRQEYQIGLRGYLDREVSSIVEAKVTHMPRSHAIAFISSSSIFNDAPNKDLVEEVVAEMLKTMVKGGERPSLQEKVDINRVGALGALGFTLVEKLKDHSFVWDSRIGEISEIIGVESIISPAELLIATMTSLKAAGYAHLPDYIAVQRTDKKDGYSRSRL